MSEDRALILPSDPIEAYYYTRDKFIKEFVEDLKRVVELGGIGEGNWISPGQIKIIQDKWEEKLK